MKPLHVILAVAVLGLLLWLGLRSQKILEDGLPPFDTFNSQDEARAAAVAYKVEHGGEIVRVLGTGSMAPYIPAARVGLEPRKTVVAYIVTKADGTYASITPGVPVLYTPEWSDGIVMHGAALKDSGGWIMSGLANKHSEPHWRVTPTNFVGIAAHTFLWSQD